MPVVLGYYTSGLRFTSAAPETPLVQRDAAGPAGPSVNIGWGWIRGVLLDGTSAIIGDPLAVLCGR